MSIFAVPGALQLEAWMPPTKPSGPGPSCRDPWTLWVGVILLFTLQGKPHPVVGQCGINTLSGFSQTQDPSDTTLSPHT